MNTLKRAAIGLFCLLLLVGSIILAVWIVRPQWLQLKPDEKVEADHEPEPEPIKPVEPSEPVIVKTRAEELLSEMSLEDKIGQIFFIRCPLDEELESVMELQPGGVILFGRDLNGKTSQEVIDKNALLQSMSKLPLLIGVDEEGGIVNRVSWNPALVPTPFPSPQALYNEGGLAEVSQDAKTKSSYLLALGINVNLAPVADVTDNPEDYMYPRTVGLDGEGTAAYVAAAVDAMNEMQIGSCLKHFPGYGSNIDTHEDIAVDERTKEVFYNQDFIPFKAGIDHQAPAILVAHNIVTCFDELPASLSPTIHELLRNELNFQGVIMSDDLSMQAIRKFTDEQEPSVEAFLAGNDLLIITDFKAGAAAMKQAVDEGKVSEERLNESVLRIINWKLSLNLMD